MQGNATGDLGNGIWGINVNNGAVGRMVWNNGSGNNLIVPGNISNNTYHRVVFVREGLGSNQFKVYVDGALSNSTMDSAVYTYNGIYIGGDGAGIHGNFNGSLDDIRFYNGYAWTSANVITDWNSGNGQEITPTNPIGMSNISAFFNSSSYDTSSESFMINFSLNTTPSGILVYAGNNYTSTATNLGNGYWKLSNTLDIPSVSSPTLNNFYWVISSNNGNDIEGVNTQSVNQIVLSLCNATQTTEFLNFTFKNETASQETITASITSSSFSYWLGSGSVNKTYTFSNSSVNPSYAFCISPSSLSYNIIPNILYTNPASITRTYNPESNLYASNTANTVLYLLPSSLGIYSRYVTQITSGGILSNVLVSVTRSLGGSTINVGSGVTDSSGLFAIFLDPTATYSYSFSKSGYNTNTFSLTPNSVDTYTVYMSSTTNTNLPITNGSTIANNISYTITPLNSSLINNTAYNFGFTILGNSNINLISMNITNLSGYQLGFSSNSGLGSLTASVNTGNYSYIVGNYIIQTPTENVSFSRTWIVANYNVGTYSLYAVMTSWDLYGFAYDYYKIVIILLTLFVCIGGLSKLEVIDTSESKIGVGIMILWAYSFVGWLSIGTPIVDPLSPFYEIQSLATQYGIAFIATIVGIVFTVREVYS